MNKIYRQGNDNKPSDFKDSEMLLQDFINRYVNPNDESPMKKFALGNWSNQYPDYQYHYFLTIHINNYIPS